MFLTNIILTIVCLAGAVQRQQAWAWRHGGDEAWLQGVQWCGRSQSGGMVRRPGARAQVSCRAVEFVVKVVLRPAIELNFAKVSWTKLAKRIRVNTVLLKQLSRVTSFLDFVSPCALTSVAWPGTRDRLKCSSKCKSHRQVSVVFIWFKCCLRSV